MNDFRTSITPEKPPFHVSHRDRIVSIGSCFSENIGKKFKDYKFRININPFGQQYNPHSIANVLQRLIERKPYTERDLVFHDELYHSFDHHGSYSRSSPQETLKVINEDLQEAADSLGKASVLFLTFGTSHVFSTLENGSIVSNCHKLSGNNFNKRLLKPDEIVTVLGKAFNNLTAINPDIKVILTVSPVRYFAFGHYENSVSKAHLFSAIYDLQQRHQAYFYFPAYELVIDDLRDYRFFSEDMLHPNYQATEYVWEKLCECMMDKQTLMLMKEIEQLLLASRHRPRNSQSEAHKKFVKKNLEKMEKLNEQFSLDFSEEEALLLASQSKN